MDSMTPYLEYRLNTQRACAEQVSKDKRYLLKIQTELGKSPLEVSTASEINKAIFSAAEKRKRANNGGHPDDGENLRYRLGQAVVGFFRWAYSENLIERNIYTKNPFRRGPRRDAYFLSEDKIRRVLNSLDDLPIRERLIILLLNDTGLRVSELCRVKVTDLNLDDGYVSVFMTKVQRQKYPAISDQTKEALSEYLKTHKSQYLIIGRRGKPMTPHAVRKIMRTHSKALGFRINPHSFRHGVGTLWKSKGAQDSEIMRQLGHIDGQMLAHYTHIAGRDLHKVQKGVLERAKVGV